MSVSMYDTLVKPRLSEISEWVLQGKSFEDISDLLKISPRTFMRYRVKYPEVQEALDAGRDYLVKKVENTLYKRLLGVTTLQKTKTRYRYDADGNKTIEWQEISEEPLYASTADYVFFLTQYPDRWVNRQNIKADIEKSDYKENQETVLDQLSKQIAKNINKDIKDMNK